MDIAALRSSLPALSRTLYFNSGASAPSPRSVLDAIESFLERQAAEGPFSPPVLQEELRAEATLRAAIADAIGADTAEITLCSNTTDGLNLIGGGVDWREGDEVVTCDQEHPSGLLPWLYLKERFGVQVRVAALPAAGHGSAEAVIREMNPRTRLVCLSHVSWCTGLRLPLREITEAAHRVGAAVLVDGAQGPGHLNVDVRDLGCDFYALSGQKWLMGPHGTGGLYIARDAIWKPHPSHLGWASAPRVTPDGAYELFPDGRRYEYATTNKGLLMGLTEALRLYTQNDSEAVWDRILMLSEGLVDRLRSLKGCELVSPRGPDLSTGLVVFRVPGADPAKLVDRLWEMRRIVCRLVDPPAVRISVHIFNTEDELDILIEEIRRATV